MSEIDVSVIIAASDGCQTLVDRVASATRAIQGRRCELIVVVRAGEAAAEIVRRRFSDVVLMVVPQRLSEEAFRNRGEAAARGRRIVFMDEAGAVPSGLFDPPEPDRPSRGGGAAGGCVALPRARQGGGPVERRRGFFDRLAERFAMLVSPRHESGRRPADGYAGAAAGRPEAGDDVAIEPLAEATAVEQLHESGQRPAGVHAEAAARCLAEGDNDGAIVHFRKAIAADPRHRAWVSIGLATALMNQERFDEADRVFLEVVQRHPDNVQGHMGRAKVLLSRQDWRRAEEAYEAMIPRFPDSVHAVIGLAEALRKQGRFDEAETWLQQAGRTWPDNAAPLRGRARVSAAQKDFSEARLRWKKAADSSPGDLAVRASYVLSLIDVLDLKEARAVFDAVGEESRTPAYESVLADIHAASYDWPAALSVLRTVVEAAPMHVGLRLKEASVLRDLARFTGEPGHCDRAVRLCETLVDEFPHSVSARLALAGSYVTASRTADAARVIDGLPDGLETHREAMELKAWRRYHGGDLAGAKGMWREIQERHYLRVVQGPIGSLELVGGHVPAPASGEVLLFTVLRNQNWRLPWFLDYYRRLGVSRFFVVDNGSDDGGTAFLLAQADVHVFRTFDSYAKADSGMRWVNELVQRYGDDHWCLYVDVDEMLVFPGVEEVGLPHLLRYMERKGHEAFFAFMLDMHGPTARYRPECRPGEDLRPVYPYFENTYHQAGTVHCPYRQVSGGIQRLFRSTWDLSKTPIIRGGRSIKFLSSSHAVTPAAVSDVTGVLLHFKMAGSAEEWSLSGIGDRNPGCVRRHLSYVNAVQSSDEDTSFMSEATVRYESSRQLVSLGLSQCPDDFLTRSSPHGAGHGT